MHAYRYPEHEQRIAALAREMGFAQVSASHEVSPLIKLVGRGDTTVVDAYLSPILRRYVATVAGELEAGGSASSPSPAWGRVDARSSRGGVNGAAKRSRPTRRTPSGDLPRKQGEGAEQSKRRDQTNSSASCS